MLVQYSGAFGFLFQLAWAFSSDSSHPHCKFTLLLGKVHFFPGGEGGASGAGGEGSSVKV